LASLRVLVVDDNEDSALSLAMLLELQGFDVRTAFRGDEALRRAESERPDVALLDIGLPDMTGYELAVRLRERLAPSVPTIAALTGWSSDAGGASGEAADFDRHFTKPVDPDALEEWLRSLDA
jgi:CheY-like chemotaxis protein